MDQVRKVILVPALVRSVLPLCMFLFGPDYEPAFHLHGRQSIYRNKLSFLGCEYNWRSFHFEGPCECLEIRATRLEARLLILHDETAQSQAAVKVEPWFLFGSSCAFWRG
jgi:hypothetical protein